MPRPADQTLSIFKVRVKLRLHDGLEVRRTQQMRSDDALVAWHRCAAILLHRQKGKQIVGITAAVGELADLNASLV